MTRTTSSQKAFTLLEILLSISMISVFVVIFITSLIDSQESNTLSEKRNTAVRLADEGLEGVRNLRDAAYTNITDGTYGITHAGNVWSLVPASDITLNTYTRTIEITALTPREKRVTVTVTWEQNARRNGSVTLVTYLGDLTKATGTTTTP